MSQATGMGGITNQTGPLRTPTLLGVRLWSIPFLIPILKLSPIEPGSRFLTLSPLQYPVGPHRNCPWLKCSAAHGCAMRWTQCFVTSAGRDWPSATCH